MLCQKALGCIILTGWMRGREAACAELAEEAGCYEKPGAIQSYVREMCTDQNLQGRNYLQGISCSIKATLFNDHVSI